VLASRGPTLRTFSARFVASPRGFDTLLTLPGAGKGANPASLGGVTTAAPHRRIACLPGLSAIVTCSLAIACSASSSGTSNVTTPASDGTSASPAPRSTSRNTCWADAGGRAPERHWAWERFEAPPGFENVLPGADQLLVAPVCKLAPTPPAREREQRQSYGVTARRECDRAGAERPRCRCRHGILCPSHWASAPYGFSEGTGGCAGWL